MKRNIFIFVFLILVAASFKYRSKTEAGILNPDSRVIIEQVADSSSEPVYSVKTENDEIRSAENQERKARMNRDTATLSQMWSGDLIVTNPDNSILSKADLLKNISGNPLANTAFDRVIDKINITRNVAVVMGHETVAVPKTPAAAQKAITRRYTNVWMKDGNEWKLTARQATNI